MKKKNQNNTKKENQKERMFSKKRFNLDKIFGILLQSSEVAFITSIYQHRRAVIKEISIPTQSNPTYSSKARKTHDVIYF